MLIKALVEAKAADQECVSLAVERPQPGRPRELYRCLGVRSRIETREVLLAVVGEADRAVVPVTVYQPQIRADVSARRRARCPPPGLSHPLRGGVFRRPASPASPARAPRPPGNCTRRSARPGPAHLARQVEPRPGTCSASSGSRPRPAPPRRARHLRLRETRASPSPAPASRFAAVDQLAAVRHGSGPPPCGPPADRSASVVSRPAGAAGELQARSQAASCPMPVTRLAGKRSNSVVRHGRQQGRSPGAPPRGFGWPAHYPAHGPARPARVRPGSERTRATPRRLVSFCPSCCTRSCTSGSVTPPQRGDPRRVGGDRPSGGRPRRGRWLCPNAAAIR